MRQSFQRFAVWAGVFALALVPVASRSKPNKSAGGVVGVAGQGPPVMWTEPQDIRARNLIYGAGGEAGQPRAPFTFTEEDQEGSNPKFDVVDGNGTKWKVKLGLEARPETAASRLVWAIGYYSENDYFLPV